MDVLVVGGLQLCAEADDAGPGPDATALQVAWNRQRDAVTAVRLAELEVEAAAYRHRSLQGAHGGGTARPWTQPCPRSCLRSLAATVLGAGVLLGVLYLALIGVALVGPGPLLVVPAAAALTAVVIVTRRIRRTPVVDDLVCAVLELREAEARLRSAQEQALTAARLVRRLAPPGTLTPPPALCRIASCPPPPGS